MIGLFLLLSIFHFCIVISVGYIGLILIKASTEISWIGTADKTLWDWLDLFGTLIVPILLVVLGFSFARSENRRAQAIADQQARSSALQRYLEQMGVLLIDKRLRDERDTTELRTQGRALTLSILDGLGPEGKRSVLRYLHGSQLSYKENVVVSLGGADLTDAYLEEISLATPGMGSADISGPDNIYERAEREDLYPLDFAVPSMVWHNFKNVGAAPGRFIAVHSPAMMEDFMREIGRQIDDPQNPPQSAGPTSAEEHQRIMIIDKYMEVLPPDKVRE